MLAEEVARALARPLLQWHIKSTTKAQQGLYEYDAVSRLRDSQLGDERVADIANYIKPACCGRRSSRDDAGGGADRRDRQGRHRVPQRPAARARPHGVLRLRDAAARCRRGTGRSSSSPPTTRRSCPTRSCAAASSTTSGSPTGDDDADRRRAFPRAQEALLAEALEVFFDLRDVPGLKKKPSTSELLDWLKLLLAEDIPPEALQQQRQEGADPAAARGAAEERAGRAPVRARRVHGAQRTLGSARWSGHALGPRPDPLPRAEEGAA